MSASIQCSWLSCQLGATDASSFIVYLLSCYGVYFGVVHWSLCAFISGLILLLNYAISIGRWSCLVNLKLSVIADLANDTLTNLSGLLLL
uniref:Uncharacterized protein n=1 Tax=Arundo donax TaxID=35708 RepID=A0A0A9GN94_ARUDO